MDHALPSFDVRDAEEASYFPTLATSGSSSSYLHAAVRPTRVAPTHASPPYSNAINVPATSNATNGSSNGGSMLSKLFPSEPIQVESKKPFASDSEDKHHQSNDYSYNNQHTAMRKVVLSTESDDRHNHFPLQPPSANNRRASISQPVNTLAPIPAPTAAVSIRSGEATPSELAETEFDILRREREV